MLHYSSKELNCLKADVAGIVRCKIAIAGLTILLVLAVCCPLSFCQSCCIESNDESNDKSNDTNFNRRRIESARLLTEDAERIKTQTDLLNRWSDALIRSQPLVLALTKETPHADVERGSVEERAARTKESSENFQSLFLSYQDARRQYLQHKMMYDEHVAAYHNQVQQQNQQQQGGMQQLGGLQQQQPAAGVLVPPQLKRLRLKAEDACANLQQMELALTTAEAGLAATVNYLASIKGKTPAETYFQIWTSTQARGGSVQRQVVDFGRDVLSKEQTSVDQLHDLTQAAQRNGDFVQSRQIYMELQRNTALNNEETKRAHLHTMFAANALGVINSLSPLNISAAPAASSSATAPEQLITNDQIQRESSALDNEYEKLQQQYAQVEKANPAHKGGAR